MRADGAAVERVAAVVLALLDEDDGVAALGELAADDRAAGARAHDDHVALDVGLGPGRVVARLHLRQPARLLDVA